MGAGRKYCDEKARTFWEADGQHEGEEKKKVFDSKGRMRKKRKRKRKRKRKKGEVENGKKVGET